MHDDLIPLHSLILCEEAVRLNDFPIHEIISLSDVCYQLVGSTRRHDLSAIMFAELRHRLALKLSLGERVVVDTLGLTAEQQRHLATMAVNQGAAVLSISDEPGHRVKPWPALALPSDIEAHLRAQQWQGITVVGDVHGELAPVEQALAWARSRHHFIWFLGDVIDYGQQTLIVADVVHDVVMRGEGAMILANHERKIARWLDRDTDHLRIGEGNRVTISALEQLSARDRTRWVGRFRALLAHTSLTQQIANVTLMHAATHPSFWGRPDYHAIEQYALFGEADQHAGRYKRTHRWVDNVPAGQMVIVGHDVISPYPLMLTGTHGGQVVFLDTGCGKGGQLSSADLRFDAHGLHLECFHRH